jgi:hypothetical protein
VAAKREKLLFPRMMHNLRQPRLTSPRTVALEDRRVPIRDEAQVRQAPAVVRSVISFKNVFAAKRARGRAAVRALARESPGSR